MVTVAELNRCGYIQHKMKNFHEAPIEDVREFFVGMVVGEYGFKSKAGVILDIDKKMTEYYGKSYPKYTASVLWNSGVKKTVKADVGFDRLCDIQGLLDERKEDVKELEKRIALANKFNEP
jgi:hypothetical protein